MNKEDVLTLAELSRLEIPESDIESYVQDFEGIIGYINTISKVQVEEKDHYQTNLTSNILRDDEGKVYEAGIFSEDILEAAPHREGDYFKVKKVL